MKLLNPKFLILFLILPGALSVFGKGKNSYFENIRIQDGYLYADYYQDELLDQELLKGLRKGLTAAIELEVQLWRDNPRILKNLIAEKRVRFKVGWDNWERRYVFLRRQGEPEFFTEDGIRIKCEQLEGLQICPIDMLEPYSRYRIGLRIVLKPMSVENVDEIRRWLAGETQDLNTQTIKRSNSPLKKAGDWLLGVVVNLSGFGERLYTNTSSRFYLEDQDIRIEDP